MFEIIRKTLKNKLNAQMPLLKKMYILIITILAPFIAKYLATTLGDGENKEISAEVWFGGWMSYIAIIASISLVYWQIDTNNKIRREDEQKRYNEKKQEEIIKEKEEQQKKDKLEMNIFQFISYCFSKNRIKYSLNLSNSSDYSVVNELIRKIKQNEKRDYEELFYEVQYNYLENNINNLVQMDKGLEILEINDSIISANKISKKLKQNLCINDKLKDLFILKSQIRNTKNQHDVDFLQMTIYLLELVQISLENVNLDEKSIKTMVKPILDLIENKISDKHVRADEIVFNFGYLVKELLHYDSLIKTGIPYINQLRFVHVILSNYQEGVIHHTYDIANIKELFKEIELEIKLISEFGDTVPPLLKKLVHY